MEKSNKQREITVESVIADSIEIARDITNNFNETKDIKVIDRAIQAYGNAIKAGAVVNQHKKLTGHPAKIKYMLDKNRE